MKSGEWMDRYRLKFLGSVQVPYHKGNDVLCAAMQKVHLLCVWTLKAAENRPECDGLAPSFYFHIILQEIKDIHMIPASKWQKLYKATSSSCICFLDCHEQKDDSEVQPTFILHRGYQRERHQTFSARGLLRLWQGMTFRSGMTLSDVELPFSSSAWSSFDQVTCRPLLAAEKHCGCCWLACIRKTFMSICCVWFRCLHLSRWQCNQNWTKGF